MYRYVCKSFYGGLVGKSGLELLTLVVVLFFIGVFNCLQYHPVECWSLELVFTHCALKLQPALKRYLLELKDQYVNLEGVGA